MEVCKTVNSIQKRRADFTPGKSLGLVPTMGALHEGHLSLIRQARFENEVVVASIFVNPTQFERKEDLENYPSSIEEDLKLLEQNGCDLVFMPTAEEVYANNITSERFDFEGLDLVMEGQYREGHFDGVGTIVRKLFLITAPDRAYFGKKDYQQLQIIRKMVEQSNIPVQIVACEIYREPDGLAMSSRNRRLKPEERAEAPLIFRTLQQAREMLARGTGLKEIKTWAEDQFAQSSILRLEYFEITDSENLKPHVTYDPNLKYIAFVAAFAGAVRLIDNIELN